nr:ribosomal protein L20 [Taxodium distichum]YP_009714211.1 ribosomal protein L20 [Taxodium mucronatum]QGJ04628.1 ribosomal protein L20 [Taxodium distichum var. imbricarium]QQV68965.1 ribosomal protein L20 [Taxodium sp. 'Zhongshanshan']QGJ04545.1 ribosomal protein L20 [Taxodium mucronatum]QGJ04711.1 ribosomal protein L20 [Taxodium distichum]QQV69048.1 ribosomal protein L20 [Taxodium sp. 'Zhongshanshan']
MTRVKRGYIAKKRRKKILAFVSGSRGAHSKLFRVANQQKRRALVSAHRDRLKRKRDFRRLWITRINAASRANGVSYNKFIQFLYKRQLLTNRRTLAQIAVLNNNCFSMMLENILVS